MKFNALGLLLAAAMVTSAVAAPSTTQFSAGISALEIVDLGTRLPNGSPLECSKVDDVSRCRGSAYYNSGGYWDEFIYVPQNGARNDGNPFMGHSTPFTVFTVGVFSSVPDLAAPLPGRISHYSSHINFTDGSGGFVVPAYSSLHVRGYLELSATGFAGCNEKGCDKSTSSGVASFLNESLSFSRDELFPGNFGSYSLTKRKEIDIYFENTWSSPQDFYLGYGVTVDFQGSYSEVTTVPEPSSYLLASVSALFLFGRAWHKFQRA